MDAVNAKLGRENILRYIANPVLTGFTLPKLLWVRDNEPQNFERVRKMLLPKDYVRFSLTGEFATEVSDASGTARVRRGEPPLVVRDDGRRWASTASILPALLRIERGQRQDHAAGGRTDRSGGRHARGGRRRRPGVSAVGNGIVEPGIVSCTLGTSGVVFAHMDKVAYDPAGRVHTFCHAVRDKWHVMGVTQGAGLSLQWFRNQLAPGTDYDALTAEAANRRPARRACSGCPT